MAVILVYNNDTDRMERYERSLNEAMPYNEGDTLKVSEFKAESRSDILWTNTWVMQAFNKTRKAFGKKITIGNCFRRVWEGGYGTQSQHYAGCAFDMGKNLGNEQRTALRNLAIKLGVWTFVEPANVTPTWVHVDCRISLPACGDGGYPLLRKDSKNNYVCVMQDALNTLGFKTGGLDGAFGSASEQAVKDFQCKAGLKVDGICGSSTWPRLIADVVGKGSTSTTINKC